ncbi:cytochrome P460 family protein [Paenibacillus sp. LjRoot153]|uniref:cytochrome P460 family protein n=1 Tax=Paenibacillus sp. LjRoot153 TaxID=3342270 RepID=UPI003ECE9215
MKFIASQGEIAVKKFLWLVLGMVTVFTLSACGSNYNDTTDNMGQMETAGEDSKQFVQGQGKHPEFPEKYEGGVLYSTLNRGNITEPLYTSREAIEAAKKGEPFPDGTVITLVIYKDEKLDETLVAEKRSDWGDQTSSEKQNGDWRYQAFNPDKSVNEQRSIPSCISCHAGREVDDFTFTRDRMKSFKLEDFTATNDNSTKTSNKRITLEEAHALSAYVAELTNEK